MLLFEKVAFLKKYDIELGPFFFFFLFLIKTVKIFFFFFSVKVIIGNCFCFLLSKPCFWEYKEKIIFFYF